jgi:hypothetical protein
MTKSKKAAAAPKAAGAIQTSVEPKRELLQSKDVHVEVDRPEPTAPVRGPMTGEAQLSDIQFLERFATKEECQIFRAAVMARRVRTGAVGWRTLPSGIRIQADDVLAGCSKCHRWMWISPAGAFGNCPGCNLAARADGGKLHRATADEERAWWAREEAGQRKWIADAPKRKAERDEWQKKAAPGPSPSEGRPTVSDDDVFDCMDRLCLSPPTGEAMEGAAIDLLGDADETFLDDSGTKLFRSSGGEGYFLQAAGEPIGEILGTAPRELQEKLMDAARKLRAAKADEEREAYTDPAKNPMIRLED